MTGKQVQKFRARLGLTQAELAAALKVDRITVVRWEGGQQRPSRLAVRALARLAARTLPTPSDQQGAGEAEGEAGNAPA